MTTGNRLPSLDGLLERYHNDTAFREYAEHNHDLWSWTHGGLELVRRSPMSVDPIEDYWARTERRVLVSFFCRFFSGRYLPARALRQLAFRVFLHFDHARESGAFGPPVITSPPSPQWTTIIEQMMGLVNSLPSLSEYSDLQQHWGRRLPEPSLQALLGGYLEQARSVESLAKIEPTFSERLSWFPYLGLRNLDYLHDKQRFFYGLVLALTSTNSYVQGGGISFAPVIQNNPSDLLLSYLERWASGETPSDTGFLVEGKSEKKDRSHHATVKELYGFLNLHRMPFSNSATAETYGDLSAPSDADDYATLRRVGDQTRSWLRDEPAESASLARLFRDVAGRPPADPRIEMEGIRRASLASRYPAEASEQVDRTLSEEVRATAASVAATMSDADAATAMAHLLLDAAVYAESSSPTRVGGTPVAETVGSAPTQAAPKPSLSLPMALRPVGNDALGYLKAGHHVLFAGGPGTGKTTLAQFVGYAWDNDLDEIATEMAIEDAPLTTVGNSAWSPFHTIGGILPDEHGRFTTSKGIFVDPDGEHSREWTLRKGALVIDEMNRADLDRCIGELYPLLSRSVDRVRPAGIPGVEGVHLHERFRLIATVNDATLDDVVFPISEGLARRFLRFELAGATESDLRDYIGEAKDSLQTAAYDVILALFDACREAAMTSTDENGEHLPFGVGYFSGLRDWSTGSLHLSPEFTERDLPEQAQIVLSTSLSSAAKVRGIDRVLDSFRDLAAPGQQ